MQDCTGATIFQKIERTTGTLNYELISCLKTSDMIKFTCQPPHVRSNKISAGVTILQQRDNDYLKDFGVSFAQEMVTIDARILPPPLVSYHPASKEPQFAPKDGSWNLRDKMVAQGVTLTSWSVLAFGTESDYPLGVLQKFITTLASTFEECGLFVENATPPISYANPYGNIERILTDAFIVAEHSYLTRPQLVLCILPNTGVPLYAEIKRVSDTVLGIATQCVQGKHIFAAKRQYCANVCLKVNVKLGGMNSFLSSSQLPFVAEKPTIIFGAYVTVCYRICIKYSNDFTAPCPRIVIPKLDCSAGWISGRSMLSICICHSYSKRSTRVDSRFSRHDGGTFRNL